MSGNTFGKLFTVTSFGESRTGARLHRRRLSAGAGLSEQTIQPELERRRTGTSRHTSQRRSPIGPHPVRYLRGRTTGTPIGLLIENEDQRSRDYEKIKDGSVRPRRLHVPAEIRFPRTTAAAVVRRRARDRHARRRWRDCAQYLRERLVSHPGLSAQLGPLALESSRWRVSTTIRSSVPIRRGSKSSTRT
jgi:chorismate synthase